ERARELPDPTWRPSDDPHVGVYIRALPESAYYPTWYATRMLPELSLLQWPDYDPVTGKPLPGNVTVRAEEWIAAERAARHAATPGVIHM
ncbi:hypothetical protein ABTM35_19480, partial [Acinetobacter baumannii]